MRRLVYKITALLFIAMLLPTTIQGASLHFAPVFPEVVEGGVFKQSVIVSSNQSINAVSGKISFPNKIFEVVSVDTGESVVDFWVSKPSFSNVSGNVTFEGVILNPGFTGGIGNIIDITYRAKRSGVGEISFISGSALANDGYGTNLIEGLDKIAVSVSSVEDGVLSTERQTFPQKLSIELIDPHDLTDPTRTFKFTTSNPTSIDFYEVSVDKGPTTLWKDVDAYTTEKLAPGQHIISVTAVDSLGRIRTASEIFEIKPLDPLTFMNLPSRIHVGASAWFCSLSSLFGYSSCVDDLAIEGKAIPNSQVSVILQNGSGELSFVGVAEESGFFSIPIVGSLHPGAYEVYAQSTDERGASTEKQKALTLTVEGPSSGSGSSDMSPATLILILGGLGLAWFLYNKKMRYSMRIQKEALEARMALRDGFDVMSKDVSKLQGMIDAAKMSNRPPTEEESRAISKLEEEIARREANIEKEIRDINDAED